MTYEVVASAGQVNRKNANKCDGIFTSVYRQICREETGPQQLADTAHLQHCHDDCYSNAAFVSSPTGFCTHRNQLSDRAHPSA
jgi:hypothetical protein